MPASRRSQAASHTGHEAMYLHSLVDRQVTVQLKLRDGEQVLGVIEYFDPNVVRLTREGKPNLLLYKHHILTIVEAARKPSSAAPRVP